MSDHRIPQPPDSDGADVTAQELEEQGYRAAVRQFRTSVKVQDVENRAVASFVDQANERFVGDFLPSTHFPWLRYAALPMAAALAVTVFWGFWDDPGLDQSPSQSSSPSTTASAPLDPSESTTPDSNGALGASGLGESGLGGSGVAASAAEAHRAGDSVARTGLTNAAANTAASTASERTLVAAVAGESAGEWTTGPRVMAGEHIVTGPAETRVLLDRQTARLDVSASTELTIREWDAATSAIDLDRGVVLSTVQPRGPGQHYRVETPYAIVEVVGTIFSVTHQPGEVTEIRCYEGKVRVSTRDGQMLGFVTAGKSLRVGPPQVLAGRTAMANAEAEAEDVTMADVEVDVPSAATGAEFRANEPDLNRANAAAARPDHRDAVAERDSPRALAGVVPPSGRATPDRAIPKGIERGRRADVAARRARLKERQRTATESGTVAPETVPPKAVPTEPRKAAVTPRTPTARSEKGAATDRSKSKEKAAKKASIAPEWSETEWLATGRKLMARGQNRQAIEHFESAPRRTWRVWSALGDAYRIGDRVRDAREAYERALSIAGAVPPATTLADLATLLSGPLGELDAAETAWTRYLRYHDRGPQAPNALYFLAKRNRSRGQFSAEQSKLEALVEHFDRSTVAAPALARLGKILIQSQRWQKAETLFKTHRNAARRAVAEASLIGLTRVQLAQGKRLDATHTLDEYEDRFPKGHRRKEAAALRVALSK